MSKPSKTLTAEEAKLLKKCEAIIDVGRRQFKETLEALTKIHDGKLYRADYKNFEDYCQKKWGFSASRARQLIGAAETVENLKSVTIVTPSNEGQVRELSCLEPDEQRKVWAETVKEKGESPTAKDIAEVRDRVIPPKQDTKDDPAPKAPAPIILPKGLKRMSVQKLLDSITQKICDVENHFPGEIDVLIEDLETHLTRLRSINKSNVLPLERKTA